MKNQILVVGRNEEIVQTLLRSINSMEEWTAKGTLDNNEAKKFFNDSNFDIVLLSSGMEKDDEMDLCVYFRRKDPSIKIIQQSNLHKHELLQVMSEIEILQWLF